MLNLLFQHIAVIAQGQNFSINQFGSASGLHARIIYSITADQQGLIWLGTDNGLFKFDGYQFKQFGFKEGLPDIEVFSCDYLYPGFLYCNTFGKKPFIVHNDKVISFEQYKNSFVNSLSGQFIIGVNKDHTKMTLFDHAAHYFHYISTKDGQLKVQRKFLTDTLVLRRLSMDNKNVFVNAIHNSQLPVQLHIIDYESKDKFIRIKRYPYPKDLTVFKSTYTSPYAIVLKIDQNIYTYHKNTLYKFVLKNDSLQLVTSHPFSNNINGIYESKKGIWIATVNAGAYKYLNGKITEHILPGTATNIIFEDKDGRIWIGANGEGLYLAKPTEIRNLSSQDLGLKSTLKNAFFLQKQLLLFGSNGLIKNKTTNSNLQLLTIEQESKLANIIRINDSFALIAAFNGDFLIRSYPKFEKIALSNNGALKDGTVFGENLFTAYHSGLYVTNIVSKSNEQIYNGRVTSLFKAQGDTLFFGTLDGAFLLDLQSKKYFPLANGIFKGLKINAIAANQESIFITSDHGLFAVDKAYHSKVDTLLDDFSCSKIVIKSPYIWVAISKGLVRIDQSNFATTLFDRSNGLDDEMINEISLNGDSVYVTTSKGLSVFHQNANRQPIPINLIIKNFSCGKAYLDLSKKIELKHNQNNIAINFIENQFNNIRGLVYEYRLLPNSNWMQTSENQVTLLNLEPNTYSFQVRRYNDKLAAGSNTAIINFTIQPPFWKTKWFTAIMLLLLVGSIYLIYKVVTNNFRKKEKAAKEIEIQTAQLELNAIRAQINPHFIYNSLNSIQSSILKNNDVIAQEQISLFSKLMRSTMDLSRKNYIFLNEEIPYLEKYIEFEKIRFKELLDISLIAHDFDEIAFVKVPSMLLQPYIENAVRYCRIQPSDEKGMVKIVFQRIENFLHCTIEDNGPGIEQMKKKNKVNHISYGTTFSRERINTINKLYNTNITLNIIDKSELEEGNCGTIIKILIPLNDKE